MAPNVNSPTQPTSNGIQTWVSGMLTKTTGRHSYRISRGLHSQLLLAYVSCTHTPNLISIWVTTPNVAGSTQPASSGI